MARWEGKVVHAEGTVCAKSLDHGTSGAEARSLEATVGSQTLE